MSQDVFTHDAHSPLIHITVLTALKIQEQKLSHSPLNHKLLLPLHHWNILRLHLDNNSVWRAGFDLFHHLLQSTFIALSFAFDLAVS